MDTWIENENLTEPSSFIDQDEGQEASVQENDKKNENDKKSEEDVGIVYSDVRQEIARIERERLKIEKERLKVEWERLGEDRRVNSMLGLIALLLTVAVIKRS